MVGSCSLFIFYQYRAWLKTQFIWAVEDLFCQIMLRFGRCITVENTFYIKIYTSVYTSGENIDTAVVYLFGQKWFN